MASSHFLHIPRNPQGSSGEAARSCTNHRRVHFSRFALTIPQAFDGINCFLQLFILKLRTCSFCLSAPCRIPPFWALHTIRYFLTDFRRILPGFFPLFPFFARLPIGAKCTAFAQFVVLLSLAMRKMSVAFATKAAPSCILQDNRAHPSRFPPHRTKEAQHCCASLGFTALSAGILSARQSRPGGIPRCPSSPC